MGTLSKYLGRLQTVAIGKRPLAIVAVVVAMLAAGCAQQPERSSMREHFTCRRLRLGRSRRRRCAGTTMHATSSRATRPGSSRRRARSPMSIWRSTMRLSLRASRVAGPTARSAERRQRRWWLFFPKRRKRSASAWPVKWQRWESTDRRNSPRAWMSAARSRRSSLRLRRPTGPISCGSARCRPAQTDGRAGHNRRVRRWGRVRARFAHSFSPAAPTIGRRRHRATTRRRFAQCSPKSARFPTAAASSNCASRNIGRACRARSTRATGTR